MPYYVAALALLYLEVRGRDVVPRVAVPRWPAPAWIALLVACYAAQLDVVRYAAVTVASVQPWRAALPIGVAEHGMAHPDAVEAAMLILAAVEVWALAGLYGSRAGTAAAIAGFLALVALSIWAPATISPDVYAYAGDALLGRSAYHPPNAIFPGEYASIDRLFHPLLPAPYGPLWIAVDRIVTAPFTTLYAKIVALRVLGAFCYLGLIAALRGCGVPPRLLAVAAVNPCIAQQYVADAHNDLMGIAAIVVGAALIGARRPILGAAAVVVAALVKLPFVLLAFPVFIRVRSQPLRYGLCAAAIAVAAALSWIGGGSDYFGGLMVHVPVAGAVFFTNALVTVAALTLLVLGVLAARRYASALWIVPMMSSYIATWYMTYGLPYALERRRILAYLLVALPLATALVDAKFMRPWTSLAALPAVVILDLVLSRRRVRSAA
ncbi:MAG TPA: hypothetical protein VKB39_06315 [Candidatus Baltobacteraceae bacterium]|nr:hypothetical protein [Candidatus Baltobacteraceae bacterium]